MSKRVLSDQTETEGHIDDLIRVLTGKNADPTTTARCLRHLATILETLDDRRAARSVSERLDDILKAKPL